MSQARSRRDAALDWFGLLGGMGAFALYLLAAFYLVPAACQFGTVLPIAGVTVVLGSVAAGATAVSWLRRKSEHSERVRFMAQAGLLLNVFGLLFILYSAASVAVFDPCVNWPV